MSSKIILVNILVFMESKAIINPRGPTVISDYTNCVNNIIDNDFKKPGLLIFADTKNASNPVYKIRNDVLNKINKGMNFALKVMTPRRELDVCKQDDKTYRVLHADHFEAIKVADYYVIIVDNYTDFSFLFSRFIRVRSWNPNAKFVILVFNSVSDIDKIENVEKILTCLFKYNAINVVIIAPHSSNFRDANIYSWCPYDPPKHCGFLNENAKGRVIEQNVCQRGVLKQKNTNFECKVPKNMNGCVLNILALQKEPFIGKDEDDVNIEEILINEILEMYHLKGNYTLIDEFRGERDTTGMWSGGLKKLILKRGQILLGGIFPDFDVHEDFESSTTYLADSYTWVVPRALKSPEWVSLTIIFHRFVWYSSAVIFVLCVFTWGVLGKLGKDSRYNRTWDHCFLNTWVSFLGFSTYVRPSKECLRVFFVFLNMYSLLFLTAYQTKLYDVLTNPIYEYQIKSVQELVSSGLKFGGSEELHDIFYNTSDPIDQYLGSEWVDVDNVSRALIDVAVYRNFSVLCSRLELAHTSAIIPEISDEFGNLKYYAFESNMFTVSIEMVALRGFPFLKEFSNTLALFRQSGINTMVRQIFTTFNIRRRAKLLRSLLTEKSDKPLSMKHLQGGFLALALGYISGTLAFFIEFLVNNKNAQRKITHDRNLVL